MSRHRHQQDTVSRVTDGKHLYSPYSAPTKSLTKKHVGILVVVVILSVASIVAFAYHSHLPTSTIVPTNVKLPQSGGNVDEKLHLRRENVLKEQLRQFSSTHWRERLEERKETSMHVADSNHNTNTDSSAVVKSDQEERHVSGEQETRQTQQASVDLINQEENRIILNQFLFTDPSAPRTYFDRTDYHLPVVAAAVHKDENSVSTTTTPSGVPEWSLAPPLRSQYEVDPSWPPTITAGSCKPKFELGTKGVVYIYYCGREGECPAIEEAKISAASIRATSPGVKNIAIFTNFEFDNSDGVFSHVLPIENVPLDQLRRSKLICACQSPFERTLYLDTDTKIVGDISDIFGILDTYELGFARRVNGRVYDRDYGLEDSFNGGLMLYRFAPATLDFLSEWEHQYAMHHSSNKDQPPLWRTLRRSHIRVKRCTLPPNYNFMMRPESYLYSGKVKIIHAAQVMMNQLNVTQINEAPHRRRVYRPGKKHGTLWTAFSERSKIFEGNKYKVKKAEVDVEGGEENDL